MSLILIATGLVSLALPGLLRRPGRSLDPSEWARTVGVALVLGAAALSFGLVLTAAPVLFRASGAHGAADLCHQVLGPLVLGGELSGIAAGLVGTFLAWRGGRRGLRSSRVQRTMHVEPWLGHHENQPGLDLVVLPTHQLVAYAVAGPQDQVVVSDGLLATLDEDELAAVIDHERSHLAHHHARLLLLATVVDAALGWIPAIGRSCREMQLAVERWADEDAGATRRSRAALASALQKVTLEGPIPMLAFKTRCTVEHRLTAIASPPPNPTAAARVGAAAPLTVLVGSLCALLVAGSLISHHGFWGLVGLCPV
jgi:hypothetical protein